MEARVVFVFAKGFSAFTFELLDSAILPTCGKQIVHVIEREERAEAKVAFFL